MNLLLIEKWYVQLVFMIAGLWTSCHHIESKHDLFVSAPSKVYSIDLLDLHQSNLLVYQPVVMRIKDTSHLFATIRPQENTTSGLLHAMGDGRKFNYQGVLDNVGFQNSDQQSCSIVRTIGGDFVMTYVSTIQDVKQLMLAISRDLISWKTVGPAFSDPRPCSMGGVIVGYYEEDDFIAKKIDHRYWMIWGEDALHLATSTDLLEWTPLRTPSGALHILYGPANEGFDDTKLMIGPPPIWHSDGILMFYHGSSFKSSSGIDIIRPGQVVLDPLNPKMVLARSPMPILDQEISSDVVQIQSITKHDGSLALYASAANNHMYQIIFSYNL